MLAKRLQLGLLLLLLSLLSLPLPLGVFCSKSTLLILQKDSRRMAISC